MIESIEFKNFKALRDAKLPLGQLTLIVGPNGSGKSTALSAFDFLRNPGQKNFDKLRTAGTPDTGVVSIIARGGIDKRQYEMTASWSRTQGGTSTVRPLGINDSDVQLQFTNAIGRAHVFSLDAVAVGNPVHLQPKMELARNGANLPGVLDRLRDEHPEGFEALSDQLVRWVPEFDRILFETPQPGFRSICLRTRDGHHIIRAADLSQGTLIAVALLTIAYLPQPPSVVCLEDPDHGLHPRLLREVRDALYHLAYPGAADEKRKPVQVVATTHNPYFLDLFREHPEEIVIAEKSGIEATFSRLADRKDIDEILENAPLGEVWYSGVLGGVPAGT